LPLLSSRSLEKESQLPSQCSKVLPPLTLYPISSATSARITKETGRSQNKSSFVVYIPPASRPYASFSKPTLPSNTLSKLRPGNVLRPASAGGRIPSALARSMQLMYWCPGMRCFVVCVRVASFGSMFRTPPQSVPPFSSQAFFLQVLLPIRNPLTALAQQRQKRTRSV